MIDKNAAGKRKIVFDFAWQLLRLFGGIIAERLFQKSSLAIGTLGCTFVDTAKASMVHLLIQYTHYALHLHVLHL